MPTPILLDRSRPETLTDQLIAQIRSAIQKGVIQPGARLPSSRKLSEQLAISRNTVVRAYDALILDSFAESRPASGIVARIPPKVAADSPTSRLSPVGPPVRLDAVPRAPNLVAEHRQRLSFDFFPGRPNPSLFPLRVWRRYLMTALANGMQELAQYGDPAGHYDLRAAICAHVAATRAIVADPSQVIVINGAQEGISLCARLFLAPGRIAVVEAPTSQGVVYACEAAGAQIVGVPVDKDGLRVDDLPETAASLIHVSPSHQFPTGCDLPMQRRHALAAWASRNGCYILEDDCSGDLRYAGQWRPGAQEHRARHHAPSRQLFADARRGSAARLPHRAASSHQKHARLQGAAQQRHRLA
jgi:GntR family transcriptional regulator/MocR family aminotransferase